MTKFDIPSSADEETQKFLQDLQLRNRALQIDEITARTARLERDLSTLMNAQDVIGYYGQDDQARALTALINTLRQRLNVLWNVDEAINPLPHDE